MSNTMGWDPESSYQMEGFSNTGGVYEDFWPVFGCMSSWKLTVKEYLGEIGRFEIGY